MMKQILIALFLMAGLMLVSGSLAAAERMPAELAGDLGTPEGRIAFIRDGNVWMMNANGSSQMMVSEVGNADGRLSWSPDGRHIVFTRSGKAQINQPDFSGWNLSSE